ncbi:hypothetical protein N7478_002464 [Penicillium angulare]|uniref:uncharacterized protein n=1 Tax=Penicillium angulare TaxID=116970 RepID=UPI0025425990|nr:uncharacterized protein N7478_002464 [Penicillium angulare]KAJ5286778.1 hypothetical protein N7478_002464 [Penicillium angulare]
MPSPAPVATRPINKPDVGRNNYQPFGFREEVLQQGWSQNGSRPLPCDIHASHDVGIKVRDGCTPFFDRSSVSTDHGGGSSQLFSDIQSRLLVEPPL